MVYPRGYAHTSNNADSSSKVPRLTEESQGDVIVWSGTAPDMQGNYKLRGYARLLSPINVWFGAIWNRMFEGPRVYEQVSDATIGVIANSTKV